MDWSRGCERLFVVLWVLHVDISTDIETSPADYNWPSVEPDHGDMRRVGLFQSKVVLMGYQSDLDAHMMGMITEKKEGCNEIKNA